MAGENLRERGRIRCLPHLATMLGGPRYRLVCVISQTSAVPTRTIAFTTYTNSAMPLQAIPRHTTTLCVGGKYEAPSRRCFQESEKWRFAAPPACRYIALTFSQRLVRYRSAYKLHIASESDSAERRGPQRMGSVKKAASWASLKPYAVRRSKSQPMQTTCAA